jgi:hypothetical protein
VNSDDADRGEGFFDRFVFNLHPPPGGPTEPSILVGYGVYPGRGIADGFLVISTADEQRNVRFSTELAASSDGAGPFSYDVLEPMRAWRLAAGQNPSGLTFDVTWTASTPAWFGTVNVEQNGVRTAAFDHLFQAGCYTGTLALDGRPLPVGGWWGVRDRSRGVRTMSGGQGLHLWYQAEFEDRTVGFLMVEGRDHRRLLLKGGVMVAGEAAVDPIVDVGHDLEFDDNLDLVAGRVGVMTASGAMYAIDADARAGGGYMAGAGYGGHHGKALGRDHLEHEVYPLDGSVTPRTVDTSLTDRLTSFAWDGQTGIGILEFALTRSGRYKYTPARLG